MSHFTVVKMRLKCTRKFLKQITNLTHLSGTTSVKMQRYFPFYGTFSIRVCLLAGPPMVVQRVQFNSWLYMYLNTVVVRYRSLTDY